MFAKSVLVTGGNRGLGLGLVKQLAVKTQHLFAGCRQPSDAEELQAFAAEHSNVTLLELDVTKGETIIESVRKIASITGTDGLNCLINNAGVLDEYTTIEGITADTLLYLFKTNAVGPALLSKACLPLIRRASKVATDDDYMGVSRAGIVNITAILGSMQQNVVGRNYGYRMSKAALNMVTKNLSVELKRDKIISVSMHPGWVRTSIGGNMAPLSVEKSVKGIIHVLSQLREGDTGSFFNYDGNPIPW